LAGRSYRVVLVQNLNACEAHIQGHPCCALIVDLDTVAIGNRDIGRIKKNFPEIRIIAKSERTFHPELEESLRSFIFACLAKPLDLDELNFWLRSVASVNECP
jgi:DNA-binding NtrC family response regulator